MTANVFLALIIKHQFARLYYSKGTVTLEWQNEYAMWHDSYNVLFLEASRRCPIESFLTKCVGVLYALTLVHFKKQLIA